MDLKEQTAILDLTIRLYCLEKILLEKNILTKDELVNEFSAASDKLIRDILKAANYEGDLEEAVKKFKNIQNKEIN
jgi:hypothetical protein